MAELAITLAISTALSVGASYLLAVNSSLPTQERGKLSDLRVTGSSYGAAIPQIWGRGRFGGNLIWVGNRKDGAAVPTGTAGATHLREERSETRSGGKGGKPKQTTVNYAYYSSFAVAICKGQVQNIRKVWGDDILIYDANATPQTKYDLRIYSGDESQLPDTVMESFEGMGNVPAYRGLCYVVFDELDLTPWGGRIPSLSFEVATAPKTVADVLTGIAGQVGLAPSDYDFTPANALAVDGFAVSQRSGAAELLVPILQVYHCELVESDGKLRVVRRGGAAVASIAEGDLAARSGGGETPVSVEVARSLTLDLPGRLDLAFFNADDAFSQSVESAIRYSRIGDVQDYLTVQSGLVLTPDAARRAAEAILYDLWTAQKTFTFAVPPRYIALAPGDVLNLTVNGQTERARVSGNDVGSLAELRFTCISDDAGVLSQVASGNTGSNGGATVAISVKPTSFVAWSGTELSEIDALSPGFYVVATGESGWGGAAIYYSSDGGTNWIYGGTTSGRGTLGTATTSVGNFAGTPDTYQSGATVNVSIVAGGAVESASAAEVDAGTKNAAILGQELIGFASVTPLGNGAFRLATIRRGRMKSAMTGHAVGERFAVLSSATSARVAVADSLVGQTVQIKCIGAGETLAGVAAKSVVIAAANRPFASPQEVAAVAGNVDSVAAEIAAARSSATSGAYPSLDARLEAMESAGGTGGGGAGFQIPASYTMLVDTSIGNRTVQLPDAGHTTGDFVNATIVNGTVLLVKKRTGDSNSVTVTTNYPTTPYFEDTVLSKSFNNGFGYMLLRYSDETDDTGGTSFCWQVIGKG